MAFKTTKENRKRALKAFDGKCGCCDYKQYPEILEFHHIEPDRKVESISKLLRERSWGTIVSELRKCVLLCPNCHSEIHANRRKLPNNIKKFNESFATYKNDQGTVVGFGIVSIRKQIRICEWCGRNFTSPQKKTRCCSRNCGNKWKNRNHNP